MKIIAVHRGFACDHSSTSYEFLAVDKPLDEEARHDVASLSSRADPTQRRVSFVYHADGYDIPGGWQSLMRQHYDVMYSESYGWWTFAMAFDAPKEQQEALGRYEFSGADDLGVSVSCDDSRVTVVIHCHANHDSLYEFEDGYEDYGYGFEDEDDGDDGDDEDSACATSDLGDGLLGLLSRARQQLIEADYRALYAVWEVYGDADGDEEDAPPRPPDGEEGRDVVEEFRALLGNS